MIQNFHRTKFLRKASQNRIFNIGIKENNPQSKLKYAVTKYSQLYFHKVNEIPENFRHTVYYKNFIGKRCSSRMSLTKLMS